jgi:hypothetical protein
MVTQLAQRPLCKEVTDRVFKLIDPCKLHTGDLLDEPATCVQ